MFKLLDNLEMIYFVIYLLNENDYFDLVLDVDMRDLECILKLKIFEFQR